MWKRVRAHGFVDLLIYFTASSSSRRWAWIRECARSWTGTWWTQRRTHSTRPSFRSTRWCTAIPTHASSIRPITRSWHSWATLVERKARLDPAGRSRFVYIYIYTTFFGRALGCSLTPTRSSSSINSFDLIFEFPSYSSTKVFFLLIRRIFFCLFCETTLERFGVSSLFDSLKAYIIVRSSHSSEEMLDSIRVQSARGWHKHYLFLKTKQNRKKRKSICVRT